MTTFTRTIGVLLLVFCGNFQPVRPAGAGGAVAVRRHASAATRANANLWVRSAHSTELCDIGRGKGIVFSPDLSEPGNREFFRALGFAYFEDPDWRNVLSQLKSYNQSHPSNPVEVLLIQSHGTNGDALKLQNGSQADAARSYISAGALLENLEDSGVHTCLLAACNAGRLFRPENVKAVKPGEGNKLFEPATLGIINASSAFDLSQSGVTAERRAESHLELINECHVSEFSPVARAALVEGSNARLKAATRIAVPEMLIQLLLHDERLHLVSEGFEVERSSAETDDSYRERLISRFLNFVNAVAARERQASESSPRAD
ncbi:MAG: hypothetical protein JWM21_2929 [Acidobacteria bacterium]|nr:hypothetical protein [Acidobacteriota bacterium]